MTIKNLDSVFHLAHAVKRQMHQQIEALDMDVTPTHLRVAKIIDRHAPCTAIDIAHFIHRDKAQVTRLLKPLIDQGLIVKVANPEDKRSQHLAFTDKGKKLQQDLAEIEQRVIKAMLEGIDEQDLNTYIQVSSTMAQNLSR